MAFCYFITQLSVEPSLCSCSSLCLSPLTFISFLWCINIESLSLLLSSFWLRNHLIAYFLHLSLIEFLPLLLESAWSPSPPPSPPPLQCFLQSVGQRSRRGREGGSRIKVLKFKPVFSLSRWSLECITFEGAHMHAKEPLINSPVHKTQKVFTVHHINMARFHMQWD